MTAKFGIIALVVLGLLFLYLNTTDYGAIGGLSSEERWYGFPERCVIAEFSRDDFGKWHFKRMSNIIWTGVAVDLAVVAFIGFMGSYFFSKSGTVTE